MFDESKLIPGVIILSVPDEESWDELMDAIQRLGFRQERARFSRSDCLRLFEYDGEYRWKRADRQTYLHDGDYRYYTKYEYDEILLKGVDANVASLFDELFE